MWLHRTDALAASPEGVRLADGHFLPAEAVVLATGNQLPAAPAALSAELLRSNRVIGDPWNSDALRAIEPEEAVLLIGTGLTAVDVLLALRERDHRGPVLALSRRGLLPRQHLLARDPRRQPVRLDAEALPRGLRALTRHLRREAERLARDGVGWQCLIDALRPVTTELWMGLSLEERRRFMRRLRPFWEVLRHRAAPEAAAVIEGWCARGTLQIEAGAVTAVAGGDGLLVTIARRGGGSLCRRFDRIVLCTGPETDVRRWPAPLFRQLLADRLIQPDALGLGLSTADSGAVLSAAGEVSPWLYTLGGLRRPHLWETTAVPDIVRQASALAGALRRC